MGCGILYIKEERDAEYCKSKKSAMKGFYIISAASVYLCFPDWLLYDNWTHSKYLGCAIAYCFAKIMFYMGIVGTISPDLSHSSAIYHQAFAYKKALERSLTLDREVLSKLEHIKNS